MPREEIFLTSKLWNTHHPNVKEGLQKTLDSLGVDYLDLYVRYPCMEQHLYNSELTSCLLAYSLASPFGPCK